MTQEPKSEKPGTERARDEQRETDAPRYHGGAWSKADDEQRIDPSEGGTETSANKDVQDALDADLEPDEADPAVESSGDQEGMGRGVAAGHGSKK